MPTHDPQTVTVLLPSNLGLAGNYGPTVPLARFTARDSLFAGRLCLRATLDEMIKIRNMSQNLDDDHRDLLRETRAQYDNLLQQKNELELIEKRNWLYKLFNSKSRKRATRTFANDAFELWDSTVTTSDKLKRNFLSTRATDLTPVESESIAKDENVSGLAVDVNVPVTQEAIDTVREAAFILASVTSFAFPDGQDGQTPTLEAETSSSARSSITTSLSSPDSASSFTYLNLNINYNVVNSTDSTASGLTINNNSSGSSGSVTDYYSPVNSKPP